MKHLLERTFIVQFSNEIAAFNAIRILMDIFS